MLEHYQYLSYKEGVLPFGFLCHNRQIFWDKGMLIFKLRMFGLQFPGISAKPLMTFLVSYRTKHAFQVKRSSAKLDIYRKFSNALAVSVIASVTWIVYEV